MEAQKRLAAIRKELREREQAEAKSTTLLAAVDRPMIVAEGDSWFDYPVGRDILWHLEHSFDYRVKRAASPGATLYDMAYGPDDDSFLDFAPRETSQLAEAVKLIEDERPEIFLISGGGNDLAGPEFNLLLNHKRSELSRLNVDVAAAVMNTSFKTALRLIIETVLEAAHDIGHSMNIIIHGYDYPFPDGRAVIGGGRWGLFGPWFDRPFFEKGYDRETPDQLEERRTLLIELLDLFNEMARQLDREYGDVSYLDLRQSLPIIDQWTNELHPTNSGFRILAEKFHERIRRISF